MLKAFAEYLQSMKENKTYEINGEVYSDNNLIRVPKHVERPMLLELTSLDSVVQLVKAELTKVAATPLFVQVVSPRKVSVFSTLDEVKERDSLYRAVCDGPDFRTGWRSQEEAIIELRSNFIPDDDVDYLLNLLGRISKESEVMTEDNGVSQTVSARNGIALRSYEPVRPRVCMAPFRTFLEVDQPHSEFILRLDEKARVGLFEADGGHWKLEAKANIKAYFEAELAKEIADGKVVVMV